MDLLILVAQVCAIDFWLFFVGMALDWKYDWPYLLVGTSLFLMGVGISICAWFTLNIFGVL